MPLDDALGRIVSRYPPGAARVPYDRPDGGFVYPAGRPAPDGPARGAARISYDRPDGPFVRPKSTERRLAMPRMRAWDAGYTSPGPHPFDCDHCRNYQGDGECSKVAGPYMDGLVLPCDTCALWESGVDLTRGGPVRGDEGPVDSVPAMLSPDEYVLPGDMVDELGGEERLDRMRGE